MPHLDTSENAYENMIFNQKQVYAYGQSLHSFPCAYNEDAQKR